MDGAHDALACSHLLLAVSDLGKARDFYHGALGFPIVEEHPTMFAFRAGAVRFSVFEGGATQTAEQAADARVKCMFRCTGIDNVVSDLRAKGIRFDGEVQDAPGFMRHIELRDPDNNLLYLAEYARDPLKPV